MSITLAYTLRQNPLLHWKGTGNPYLKKCSFIISPFRIRCVMILSGAENKVYCETANTLLGSRGGKQHSKRVTYIHAWPTGFVLHQDSWTHYWVVITPSLSARWCKHDAGDTQPSVRPSVCPIRVNWKLWGRKKNHRAREVICKPSMILFELTLPYPFHIRMGWGTRKKKRGEYFFHNPINYVAMLITTAMFFLTL